MRGLGADLVMIIAIDGPAASGKGTLAKRLAAHYGLRHLDTGLLYRAVAKALLDAGTRSTIAAARDRGRQAIDPARFDEAALKRDEVGEAASVVSAIPEVRAALFDFQQEFAAATARRRARRPRHRHRDLPRRRGEDLRHRRRPRCAPAGARWSCGAGASRADEAAVLADILARDERDRSARPPHPCSDRPHDAHLLDTTHLDIDARVPGRRRTSSRPSRAGRGRG